MKTLVTTHWITLDGYVAGPGDSMDWIRADDDLRDYELALVNAADTLLLGRATYGDFLGYWPAVARDPSAEPSQRAYAQRLDQMHKVVASRTLTEGTWPETTVISDLTAESVAQLKAGEGSIVVYGSVTVVRELMRLRLVHPLTVGGGTLLFDTRVELEPTRQQVFASGVTLMVLRPA